MTDKTEGLEVVAEIALDSNGDAITQWNPNFNPVVGDKFCSMASAQAAVEAAKLRQAPCLRFCESNAYEIELRGLRSDLVRFTEFSKLAGRAMNDAYAVIDTVDGECFSEREKLSEVLNALRELTSQAYTLNRVMSAGQLKAMEGKS